MLNDLLVRRRALRIATVASAIGLATGLGACAYGQWGPWYETVPVRTPISFQGRSTTTRPFSVGRGEKYFIEVHFQRLRDQERVDRILGDITRKHKGVLDVGWRVRDSERVVASGSNKEYGYSPILSAKEDGVVIGSFVARRGTRYVVSLEPHNREPSWDELHPRVQVRLHPADLEYLIGYSLLGAGLALVSGTALLACFTVRLSRAELR